MMNRHDMCGSSQRNKTVKKLFHSVASPSRHVVCGGLYLCERLLNVSQILTESHVPEIAPPLLTSRWLDTFLSVVKVLEGISAKDLFGYFAVIYP